MLRKTMLVLMLATVWLAACSQPTPTQRAEPTRAPEKTQPVGQPYPYPAPAVENPGVLPPVDAYPAPGAAPSNPYSPAAGDEKLERGNAFPELGASELVVMESYPLQVSLHLVGNLPTPCNQLRIAVPMPDEKNGIKVEVYSIVEKGKVCTDVLQPFDVTIPLGSYSGNKYQVYINGELLGEFGA
jgi:hypothetical protein